VSDEFKVLIVDSDVNERNVIAAEITKKVEGTKVLQTHTVNNALRLTKEEGGVDVIICDLDTPSVNAYELIQQLRKVEAMANIAAIVMSKHNDRDTLLKATSEGVTGFVAKPFDVNTFARKVKRLQRANEKRSSLRVATFGAFKAEIVFKNDARYKGLLLDISLGGCLIQCTVFHEGGCIHDRAKIRVKDGTQSISLVGVLTRMARTQDTSDKKHMTAAFQFEKVTQDAAEQISQILGMKK